MLTFAYTVLVITVASIALYYWNRFEKAQARSDWRKQRQLMRARIAKIDERTATKVTELENKILTIENLARKNVGLPEVKTNPLKAMEDRHAKALEQVVSVGDKPVMSKVA